MSENKIAAFLKQLRKTSEYSANYVVEKLKEYNIDISAKTLYGYESGLSMLNADVFVALCRVYKCDNPMDIFGSISLKPNEVSMIENYRLLDPFGQETVSLIIDRELERTKHLEQTSFAEIYNIPDPSVRLIQYFHKVSAETGQVIYEDTFPEQITIPAIPKYKRVAYAVKVDGKSMEPRYNDGDLLLIEPTCNVEAGEIGIFNVDGKAYVKKLGDGELISLNDEYDNIPLTEDSKCMGRVVDKFVIK